MCVYIHTRIHRPLSLVACRYIYSVEDSISPRDTCLASSTPPKRASGKYPKGKRTRANGYDRPSGWSSKTVAEIAAEEAARALANAEVAIAYIGLVFPIIDEPGGRQRAKLVTR